MTAAFNSYVGNLSRRMFIDLFFFFFNYLSNTLPPPPPSLPQPFEFVLSLAQALLV